MGQGGAPWAFLGLISGFWKIVLVTAVTLALYGRMGLPRHPLFRLLQPWSSTPRRPRQASTAPTPWYNDRWFIFLLVIAATAVVAWTVTRMTLIQPASQIR